MPETLLKKRPATADLSGIFSGGRPVEVEIGAGRGKYLFARASRDPDIQFIGIDRVSKWLERVKLRAQRETKSNLRIFKCEARDFLAEVPAASISVFHIYFPDPWPKRRHHKRRLLTADFLALLNCRLVPGGFVEIATDDPDYFAEILQALEPSRPLWSAVRQQVNRRFRDEDLKTHYEMRFERMLKPLYYLELCK